MEELFKDFNPELQLERDEAANLAALVAHPGFKVIQKIFRCGVDQFAVSMLNTDQADRELVLSRHNAARTAAQFYTWGINHINGIIQDYVHEATNDKPIESAENLDLGEYNNLYEEEEPLV
jgi:hypothetical protein